MAELFIDGDDVFFSPFFSACTPFNQPLELMGSTLPPPPPPPESDLKLALAQTSVELESARILAQQELHQMELQALQLLHLLNTTMQERDEARRLLHRRTSDRLHVHSPPPGPTKPFEARAVQEGSGESRGRPESPPEVVQVVEAAVRARGLPQKGRLVEAVMSAGPLLQMLLLAGPLPQWQHPPPELRSSDIPPVTVGGVKTEVVSSVESNRGMCRPNGVTYL